MRSGQQATHGRLCTISGDQFCTKLPLFDKHIFMKKCGVNCRLCNICIVHRVTLWKIIRRAFCLRHNYVQFNMICELSRSQRYCDIHTNKALFAHVGVKITTRLHNG